MPNKEKDFRKKNNVSDKGNKDGFVQGQNVYEMAYNVRNTEQINFDPDYIDE